VLVGALLLGFAAQFMLLSQVSQARDQDLAFDALRVELADSKAPVGQVGPDDRLLPLGTPVAILEIESLGLRQVVLEGTTSAILMSGPGHRRDTPLPGQAGASVIYGRQSAYGAPFARIASLRTGAEISVTTGQGESRYRVTDVRRSGDQISGTIGDAAGRLTLVTASGIPFLPDGIVRVDAELVGSAKTTPSRVLSYPALGEEELAMTGDDSALPRLVLALLALVVLAPLASLGIRTWGRWQVWIVAVPTFAALGIWAARELAILLPNLT
jgi:LPXTG-site transpeptidase (sortase) family protein